LWKIVTQKLCSSTNDIYDISQLPTKMKKKKYTFFTDIRRNKVAYVMLIPAVLYTVVFGYCTLPYMLIAFQKFSYKTGLFGSEWVGLKNFRFFFGSQDALRVISNTLKLNLLFIVCTIAISVTLAIMINEIRNKYFKKVAQSTYLLPYFLSWVIVNYILYGIIGNKYGMLNHIIEFFGGTPINFYNAPEYWTIILVIAKVWKDLGMNMVIYLATLVGFDEELYDAAAVSGATRWQMCWKITLPMLMPTVLMLGIISIGKIFYGDFGMIYALVGDNGILYNATDVIDTYVFRTLRSTGNPSQSMAISLFQAIMGFICVWGANYITKKKFQEGALF
jgi:putative aldouronate transport system permease protein